MQDSRMQSMFHRCIDEHVAVFQRLEQGNDLLSKIMEMAKLTEDTMQRQGAIYLCGNGGSAADAQHIATEFVSRFYMERKAMNAQALTVNTSSLTAIGNDYSFDRVFVRQLEACGREGDTLIGITTSGTSENVLAAMDYAVRTGMHTILLTGNRALNNRHIAYDCVIQIPSDDTPRIQEAHIFIGHLLAEYIESRMVERDKGQ